LPENSLFNAAKFAVLRELRETAQSTFINSTSKISVAFGGMTPPAPRAP
jgi:hypothetical protein